MTYLAKNLLTLRSRNSLNQSDLQEQLGVKQSTWSNWEKGVSKPSVDLLLQISQHFGISLDALITSDLSDSGQVSDRGLLGVMKRLGDVEKRLTLIEDGMKKR